VCLDLSAVKTGPCCGVSYPSPVEGFSHDEIFKIAFESGQQVRQFSISEYNPTIEKFRTGTLVLQILTQFIYGLNSR
jgi:hypothetical protein